MKWLFIITSDDGETIYNAMRLANVSVKKGDEVSVFMLGKGVLFAQADTERFPSWRRSIVSKETFMSEGFV
jgi:uncharacterized protein involved in oxidation of intracellular sulfur